jgi:hypothetical protein
MDDRRRHVPFIKGQGKRSAFARPCRSFVCDPFQAHTRLRERERAHSFRSEGNSKTRRLLCKHTCYS